MNPPVRWVAHVGRTKAEGMEAIPDTAIISISDPRTTPPLLDVWSAELRLRFDDATENDALGDDILFTRDMATETIGFIDQNSDQNFVVHCEAGISRSAAVAQFISDVYGHILQPRSGLPEQLQGYVRSHWLPLPNPMVSQLLKERLWTARFAR